MSDEHVEVVDGSTRWRFERAFLTSHWTCLWGRGCQGILDHPTPERNEGCCSVGAQMADREEAMTVAAYATTLPRERWQFADRVDDDDVFADATRTATKLVDGACIFLNRPGFAGGAGCALHLGALDQGESPIDWKPAVCWQLPLRVETDPGEATRPDIVTVRRWTRADWGDDGATMAWWCTEAPEADTGEQRVVDSLADELRALAGDEVYVQLRRRLSEVAPEGS